ncbi:MAG: tRNA epoxyqueuosine(34) reductase QueG [Pseudomonadota bacterium]
MALVDQIKALGMRLGFQQVGITDTNLTAFDNYLLDYLKKGHHGDMGYMEKHGLLRLRPELLAPGTKSIIVVRMNYLPPNDGMRETLKDKAKGYIARYALGRDYHNLMRKRLKDFAKAIGDLAGEHGYKVCVDSVPIMEKALAQKAGLGWTGKNTLILNKEVGSYFFLGALLTDLELPIDQALPDEICGKCKACITVCPTKAIIAPYQLDARRCISYLTIENKGPIPIEFRVPMGNRIFGCDDCQIMCPWNRYAKITDEKDFHPRHQFDNRQLVDLFLLSEEEFIRITEGSPIKRAGYEGWLRNIAVALGNAPFDETIINALKQRQNDVSELVREHVAWALDQLAKKCSR